MWKVMTEQIDWRAKQPSQVACISEDLKCWGAWDTTSGHKAKDITLSIAWRREAWKEKALDDLPWKAESGPSSIRWTLGPFQRRRWGNFSPTEWSAYGIFRAHRYISNWTEFSLCAPNTMGLKEHRNMARCFWLTLHAYSSERQSAPLRSQSKPKWRYSRSLRRDFQT